MAPEQHRPRRAPSLRLRPSLAFVLGLAGFLPQAEPANDPPWPSLAYCRERIAAGAAGIDGACLRQVYAQPIAQWPAPHLHEGAVWSELAPLPAHAPAPPDNPGTLEKIALGHRLFEDPRLSRSGQIACASCHDRRLGWSDGRAVSLGHERQTGRRNAPSVAMAAHLQPLFWDGRAATLEQQALHPIQDPREMAFTLEEMEQRLSRSEDYPARFERVFGTRPIQARQVAQALAAYQRTLAPRGSRFDRFLEGRRDLLNDKQLWGLHLFRTRAGCMNCHSGPTLSDGRFHNLGLHFFGRRFQDLGRYEATGDPADSGRFRTPSLRGVSGTGPWMHNGLFTDLRGIVLFYNAGGTSPRPRFAQRDDPLFPRTDPLLQPLGLQQDEVDALTALLEAL